MPTAYSPQVAWPVRFPCDVSTASPTVTGKAVAFASDVLYQLTGQQFGLTQATLRPCRDVRRGTPFPDGWLAWPGTLGQPLVGGSWYGDAYGGGTYGYFIDNLCASCSSGCGCAGIETAKLPAAAHDIVQIKVDGVVLPSTSYRVDGYYLVRTDGIGWPIFNDLRLNDSQIGTWSVTGHFGQDPPAGAELAVGELACEVIRAINGEDCRLPKNLASVARQGVTITINEAESARAGLTGLYLTDLLIRTWNPNGLRGRSRAYSVESLLNRRVGT
jgi:hypothetical protein